MLGRLGKLNMKRRRKGKCSSETTGSNKSSAKRKRVKRPTSEMAHPKTDPFHNDWRVWACSNSSDPAERFPHIICECQGMEDHPRCRAIPNLGDEWDGKENKMSIQLESDHCRIKSYQETMAGEETDASDKYLFPDDDSNHVLPVEQFFGNLEVVQDCPQRPPPTSTWGKREHRRRRYYAKEDSDEEGFSSDMQPDDRPDC